MAGPPKSSKSALPQKRHLPPARDVEASAGNRIVRSTVSTAMKKILMSLVAAALIGTGACATDDDASRGTTAVPSSPPATERHASSEQLGVVLDNVRYDCGPTDATVIHFEATAETPFSGRADLVVLDDTFGSIGVDVGPTPSEYLMDTNLSQAAFDTGEGHVRVTSDDGSVVANEPVVLRLEPGVGCG